MKELGQVVLALIIVSCIIRYFYGTQEWCIRLSIARDFAEKGDIAQTKYWIALAKRDVKKEIPQGKIDSIWKVYEANKKQTNTSPGG